MKRGIEIAKSPCTLRQFLIRFCSFLFVKTRVDPQRFSEVLYGFRSVSALQISLGQTIVRPGSGGCLCTFDKKS